MGRPTASKENKQFGAFFANIVTVPVPSRSITVARSGEGAVFYVFAQCFPDLVRTHSRNGLTQLEFNKFLQSNDFPLIRKRNRSKSCVSPRAKLEFFPPSSFRFAGRRWRNPDDQEDLAYLCSAWPIVSKGLKAISFEGFCDAMRDAIRLDEQMGEMVESGSETNSGRSSPRADTLSACSTPRGHEHALFGSEFGDSETGMSECGACEAAEQSHFDSESHLLDLPLVDSHEFDFDTEHHIKQEDCPQYLHIKQEDDAHHYHEEQFVNFWY